MMIVGQVVEKYIDSNQNIASVLYFVRGATIAEVLSRAANMSPVLQSVSGVTLLDQTVHFDNEVTRLKALPSGTFKRRLVVYCRSNIDPVQGRFFTYKIPVIDPDPDILDDRQIRFDETRPRSLAFITNFLENTSDIYGNLFGGIVGSEVIEF